MSHQRLFWVALAALALMLAWRWDHRPIEHPPGVLAPAIPVQQAAGGSVFAVDDYILTRRARFEIRARVLGKERYRLGQGADLSPVDLALGWGPMSDSAVLDGIKVSQSGRWYYLRWEREPPLAADVLMGHSGNMHMVPATSYEAKALKGVRPGQVVTLKGYLVDVDHENGFRWRTSLSRDDLGDGACEIVYVESVIVEEA
ncbi:hypothetical protein F3N42_02490 [Marinihelvus fidelis]|uniref:Uncharacterized protein n=1 Tax=Marinihelvus fidelis TaxID=2613842 RepID=A0A5N0TDZ7_9GAMM|nr:hypothetical protein [Marinihelvus fidelis]KAA9133245.1 hypothetical protein F3N42_02490 [Marinihelvus fidelis]